MKYKPFLLFPLLCAAPVFAAVDEAPFQALKSYDFQNRQPVEAINGLIRGADAATMSDIETHLLAVLQDPATTFAAQEEIGRMLRVVGTARSVPVLAKLLTDEKLGNVARFALERINDASADAALRATLPTVKGKALIGIINSLGERRDAGAVALIKPLATNADADVANATISALGKIATSDAVIALQSLPNKNLIAYQSLLGAADKMPFHKGGSMNTQDIYRSILADKNAPEAARIAAARGMMSAGTVQDILEILRGDDADLRALAARFVRTSDAPIKQLSAEVEKLPAPGQALLLGALADRNDPAIAPILLRAAASPEADIRVAAMRAFASLQGGADAQTNGKIALLLGKAIVDGMAQGGSKAEEEAARVGLYGMRGAAVDEAIMAAIPDAEAPTRRELVYALGQRYTTSARPLLFKIAADDTSTSQDNAFSALNEVASAEDYASAVNVLLTMKNNGQRGAAENLVARLAKMVPDEAARNGALVAAIPAAPFETRVSILKMLGAQGGAAALNALRAETQNADPKIQDAAIRALAATPDADAMKDLLGLAKNGAGKVQQILALRGYLRLAEVRVQGGANAVEIYEPALKIATEAQEKKTIISGLSKTNTPQALAIITPLLDDENVRNEAALAIIGIAKSIGDKNAAEAKAALNKIVALSKDEATLNSANEALKAIP